MPWWGLLIEVFVVWLLWGVAATTAYAFAAVRRGIPEGQRTGVSIAPIIPVFPIGFWGMALLMNLVVGPWGTIIVAWFHAALGVLFAAHIARDVYRLRSHGKRA